MAVKKTLSNVNLAVGAGISSVMLIWVASKGFVQLNDAQYILFRLLLAVAIASFAYNFAGIFTIKYPTWKATGSFAVFLISLFFTPDLRGLKPLIIHLRDSNGARIPNLRGTISLSDVVSQHQDIAADGSVTLLSDFQSDSVTLDLSSPGWYFKLTGLPTQKIAIDNKLGPIVIKLMHDEIFCCITGTLFDGGNTKERIPLVNALVEIDTLSTRTDKTGSFRIVIPESNIRTKFALTVSTFNGKMHKFYAQRGDDFETIIPR